MTAEQIMREERERTLESIQRLPLTATARDDVLALCAAAQDAINTTVAALSRPIHEECAPAALRLIADEHERIMRRLREAGLAAPRAS